MSLKQQHVVRILGKHFFNLKQNNLLSSFYIWLPHNSQPTLNELNLKGVWQTGYILQWPVLYRHNYQSHGHHQKITNQSDVVIHSLFTALLKKTGDKWRFNPEQETPQTLFSDGQSWLLSHFHICVNKPGWWKHENIFSNWPWPSIWKWRQLVMDHRFDWSWLESLSNYIYRKYVPSNFTY